MITEKLYNSAYACGKYMLKNAKRIACAESCTGGMISSSLVSIDGCSEWFIEGAVTYDPRAKTRRLGVPSDTIERFGVVSNEVACAMAEGIRNTSGADIGIATTGVAGQSGGSDKTPVGTVYVGYCDENCRFAVRLSLNGSREEIREQAAEFAIHLAYDKSFRI